MGDFPLATYFHIFLTLYPTRFLSNHPNPQNGCMKINGITIHRSTFEDDFPQSQRIHGTGIFTYIWLNFIVNVGKYTIHGSYMGMESMRLFFSWLTYPTVGPEDSDESLESLLDDSSPLAIAKGYG